MEKVHAKFLLPSIDGHHRDFAHLCGVVDCVQDLEGSDFEYFGVQSAQQSAAAGHGLVCVEGGARLNPEHFLDQGLEQRDSGWASKDLNAVETASFEPGPLDESEEAISYAFEQIGAKVFELLAADLGDQVEVVRETLDDDRQGVAVGRHLTFHFLCHVQELGEDFRVSLGGQTNPLRTVLRVKDLHEVPGQAVVKEPPSHRPVGLGRQNSLTVSGKSNKT